MGKDLDQHDLKIGYWKGKGENKLFVPLTNFVIKFEKFITTPDQLPDYAGFIVEVVQRKGKNVVKGFVK